MDVSDGLTASLLQLRRITGCGFRIDGASLPLADSAIAAANALGVDRFELCCGASVDFELLFSVPPEKEGVFERWRVDTGADVTKIGVALPGGQMEFASPSGRVVSSLPGVPWDHQVGSIADVFAKRRD
jgi:thiamine-monophosphate kinase